MARIYVVEDDTAVRGELVKLLQRAGHEALYAQRFDNLVDDVLKATPDIVLLDLNLPVEDGQDVARRLRERSEVPIVVVTSRTTDFDELQSMTIGADDFIAKPYNGQVLLAHIDAVLRRSRKRPGSSVVEVRGLTLDLARSTVTYEGQTAELTKNELRILELLMRHAGEVVSREDIMMALWNSDSFVDDNTLTVNMNRLRQVLNSVGARGFVSTHRGVGYSA